MNKESFENFEEELTGAIKHWWVFLILGILAIGLGVWLFFTPANGFAALAIVFAITFLISGQRAIRHGAGHWRWALWLSFFP